MKRPGKEELSELEKEFRRYLKLPMDDEIMSAVKDLRWRGVLVTLEDIAAWQKLLADIFGVKAENIRPPVQPKDLEYLNKMLEELGTGQQSKRKYADVIKMYYGIGTREHSIKDMAVHFGVTPPAVRVDIGKSVRRLKHPSRSRDYKRFMMPIDLEEQILNLTAIIEDKQIEIGAMAREIKRLQNELDVSKVGKTVSEKEVHPASTDPRDLLIEDLEWSVRTFNILKNLGVVTLGELAGESESGLREHNALNRKFMTDVSDMLAKHRLKLKE